MPTAHPDPRGDVARVIAATMLRGGPSDASGSEAARLLAACLVPGVPAARAKAPPEDPENFCHRFVLAGVGTPVEGVPRAPFVAEREYPPDLARWDPDDPIDYSSIQWLMSYAGLTNHMPINPKDGSAIDWKTEVTAEMRVIHVTPLPDAKTAARSGALGALEWIAIWRSEVAEEEDPWAYDHAKTIAWYRSLSYDAAHGGSVEVLKWIYTHRSPHFGSILDGPDMCVGAIDGDQWAVIEYALKLYAKLEIYCMPFMDRIEMEVKLGRLELVKRELARAAGEGELSLSNVGKAIGLSATYNQPHIAAWLREAYPEATAWNAR